MWHLSYNGSVNNSSYKNMILDIQGFSHQDKKIWVRFSIVDFPVKPAKQKKQVALKKSLSLHTRGAPAAAAERVN